MLNQLVGAAGRQFLVITLLLTAAPAFVDQSVVADSAANEPVRPNILFVLVDDLGCMDIGANNPDPFYETPNIDRLAADGMRFTDGYAVNPVCSPTRYSIMTGRYPTRVRATNFFCGRRGGRFQSAPLNCDMALSEVTLAERLKEGGYATFFAGKWHLGSTEDFWPETQGFDVNQGGFSRGGPYGGKKYFSPYGNPRLTDGPDGEHLPDRLTTETIRFMQENQQTPFLAYLAFYSVHTPLMAPPELVAKYERKAEELGLNGKEEFADEEQIWPGKNGQPAPRRVRILQKHAVYAAMVESVDRNVGRLMKALDEMGIAENTIVCFTSDNGGLSTSEGSPTSNLPYRGGKGWVYEGGIREPLLVRWPGKIKAGTVCDVPVCSMDMHPTLVDCAGLDVPGPEEVDGVSLKTLLTGGSPPDRDALFWHYPHYSNQGGFPGGAVRMGDWKLIERYEDGRVHLYNLATDPGEQQDVAGSHPSRVESMRARLHAWYRETDAQFLQPAKDGTMPWRP